jgi:hypothetical protein
VNKYSTIFSDIKAQFIHLQVNLSGYDLESATGGSMVITVQIKLLEGKSNYLKVNKPGLNC